MVSIYGEDKYGAEGEAEAVVRDMEQKLQESWSSKEEDSIFSKSPVPFA